MSRKIEIDKKKRSIIRCHCNRCSNETNHEILMNIKVDEDEDIEDGRYSISWFDDHQIVACRGCDTISFRQVSWFSEDWNPDHNGETYYQYPERKLMKPLEIKKLPLEIEALYHEAIDAYNVGAHTLVAGGIRAIIEAICSAKGIKDGNVPEEANPTEVKKKSNLQGRIHGLHEKGYISSIQIDLLHQLRFLGNDALHEIERPKKNQIDIAFKIIESLLENIFGMEHNGKILKKFRERH